MTTHFDYPIIEISPADFDSKSSWKLINHTCSIVLFYLPSCPYCIAMKEEWIKLGKLATFFDVCAFDASKYQEHIMKIREETPELIEGYPTIIVYQNGDPVEKYKGERTASEFALACMRSCK